MRALERTMSPVEAGVQVISYMWDEEHICPLALPGTFAQYFVSHRPLKVCVQKCQGHVWREPGLFPCFNLIFLILSQVLAVGICLVLHFCPSFWASCLLENNFEPCKGSCLWHYDQRLKKCMTFIFREVQEMEIDLLIRQHAAGNVLVVFNVL